MLPECLVRPIWRVAATVAAKGKGNDVNAISSIATPADVQDKAPAFAAERADLVDALGLAVRVIERRNTIPVLAMVLVDLDARAGFARITATDLDVWSVVDVPARIEAPGRFLVDGAAFLDVCKQADKRASILVDLDQEAGRVRVNHGRARVALATIKPDDFPPVNVGNIAAGFNVPAADLVDVLARVAPAMSNEETRYYLKGIFMHALGERLAFAATCGHVLALDSLPLPAGAAGLRDVSTATRLPDSDGAGLIIPRKAVDLVGRTFKGQDQDVAVAVVGGAYSDRIRFQCGDVAILTKVVDGTFPDYRRVIPALEHAPGAWTVDADALVAFLKAAAPGDKPGVAMRLDGARVRTFVSIDQAAGTNATAPGAYAGAERDAAYNGAVMRRALAPFAKAGAVRVDLFDGATYPQEGIARITCEGRPHALALAMPLKTSVFEYRAPVAPRVPAEPAFPGQAADLFDVSTWTGAAWCEKAPGACRGQGNHADKPRKATVHECRAYVLDLIKRAGLPGPAEGLDVADNVGAFGLGRFVQVGATLQEATVEKREKPVDWTRIGAPTEYEEVDVAPVVQDGAYSLLIPGGRVHPGDAPVLVETVDADGNVLETSRLGLDRKGALAIDRAAVLDLVGSDYERAAKPERARTRKAPAPVQAPAVVDPDTPEQIAAFRAQTAAYASAPAVVDVDQAPRRKRGRPSNAERAARAAAEAARQGVDQVQDQATPAPAVQGVQEAPVDVPAPVQGVDQAPDAMAAVLARLARLEAIVAGQAPAAVDVQAVADPADVQEAPAKRLRTAAHERAVRLAWRMRSGLRAHVKARDARATEHAQQVADLESELTGARRALDAAAARLNARDVQADERADLVATIDQERDGRVQAEAAVERMQRGRILLARALRKRGAAVSTLSARLLRTEAEREGLAVNLESMRRAALRDQARIADLEGKSTAAIPAWPVNLAGNRSAAAVRIDMNQPAPAAPGLVLIGAR